MEKVADGDEEFSREADNEHPVFRRRFVDVLEKERLFLLDEPFWKGGESTRRQERKGGGRGHGVGFTRLSQFSLGSPVWLMVKLTIGAKSVYCKSPQLMSTAASMAKLSADGVELCCLLRTRDACVLSVEFMANLNASLDT